MPAYAAFLRAINVGGRTVTMARLKALFEELGFGGVETVIASGNVVFQASSRSPRALETRIAAALDEGLGFRVDTFVRTAAEIGALARFQPFPSAGDGTLYVGFLAGEPGPEAARRLLAHASGNDELLVAGREAFWLCHARLSDSKLSYAVFEKALGMPATFRNATTVARIAARLT